MLICGGVEMKHSFFSGDGNWYKGNLHAHTTESDGMQTPEERMDYGKSAGIDPQ